MRKRTRRLNTIQGIVNEDGSMHAAEAVCFDAAVKAFIRDCRIKNLSDQSLAYYRTALRVFRQVCEAPRPIDVSKADIEDGILRKKDGGLSDTAMNSYLRAWRVFFRFLYEEGYTPHNPAEDIRLIKAERRIIHTFTRDQIKKLLAVPDRRTFTGYRNYVLMLLLLDTGLRIGEVESLQIPNIRWKDRSIVVYGKGRKERVVPYQKTLDRHLKEYVKIRGNLGHDTLFVNIDNDPLKTRSMQDDIKKIGLMSGIRGVRVSPHTFRHTFAKFYIMNGGDVFSLQKILGHSTLEMCQTYVSLFGSDLAVQHSKYSPLESLQ